jgi:hypothetical protein
LGALAAVKAARPQVGAPMARARRGIRRPTQLRKLFGRSCGAPVKPWHGHARGGGWWCGQGGRITVKTV